VINAGCRAAQGDIVHVLQPGVLATDGWTAAALADFFRDPQVCAVAPLLVDAAADDRILPQDCAMRGAGRRLCHGAGASRSKTSRVLRRAIVGPGLFAGFYRRWVWEAIGGFCERLDVILGGRRFALSLRSLGYQAVLEPESVMRASPAAVLTLRCLPCRPRCRTCFLAACGGQRLAGFSRVSPVHGPRLAAAKCEPRRGVRRSSWASVRPAWPWRPFDARGQDTPRRRVFSARNAACRAERPRRQEARGASANPHPEPIAMRPRAHHQFSDPPRAWRRPLPWRPQERMASHLSSSQCRSR